MKDNELKEIKVFITIKNEENAIVLEHEGEGIVFRVVIVSPSNMYKDVLVKAGDTLALQFYLK